MKMKAKAKTKKFDQFLKRIYEATGMSSQSDLADALKINRSAITQARNKGAIPDKWILGLYRAFGLNPDWVESGKGKVFLKKSKDDDSLYKNVPKVKARLSPAGGSFEDRTEIEGFYAFRNEWLQAKGSSSKMVLMDIFGNSMEPELKDGDTILIDESQTDILAGAVYAVGIEDTIMVKRVEKHPNKLVLLSDNQTYTPIFLQNQEIENVKIIGKVVWVCREFR